MRRRLLLPLAAVVLVGTALVAWRAWPRTTPAESRGPDDAAARATRAATTAGPRPGPAGPAGDVAVKRLSPDERRQLGAQIAAARRRAAAARAAAGPVDPAGPIDPVDPADVVISLEDVGGPLRESLEAAIPLLAGCFEDHGAATREALARMTMTSDPDLGTVIDTELITGADGRPLPAALDECLRDRIDSLALPPLGAGGKLPLQYSFDFEDDAPADGATP